MSVEISLEGCWDTHVHTLPDTRPRWHTAEELARLAAEEGMAGVVLKNHDRSTVEIARQVQESVPAVRVLGGLALNDAAGGVSPENVAKALADGARIIWLPTKDAAGDPRGGRRMVTGGKVLPALLEIFELIAGADAVLATAHVAADEVLAIVEKSAEQGVRRIVVNHPEIPFLDYSVELQCQLRDAGALLERCYPRPEAVDGFDQIVHQIEVVGADSTILATDLGRRDLPPPLDGLRRMIHELTQRGLDAVAVRRMTVENPARLFQSQALPAG